MTNLEQRSVERDRDELAVEQRLRRASSGRRPRRHTKKRRREPLLSVTREESARYLVARRVLPSRIPLLALVSRVGPFLFAVTRPDPDAPHRVVTPRLGEQPPRHEEEPVRRAVGVERRGVRVDLVRQRVVRREAEEPEVRVEQRRADQRPELARDAARVDRRLVRKLEAPRLPPRRAAPVALAARRAVTLSLSRSPDTTCHIVPTDLAGRAEPRERAYGRADDVRARHLDAAVGILAIQRRVPRAPRHTIQRRVPRVPRHTMLHTSTRRWPVPHGTRSAASRDSSRTRFSLSGSAAIAALARAAVSPPPAPATAKAAAFTAGRQTRWPVFRCVTHVFL